LFELAHPAITIPYTPSDEKASRKSTPTGRSAMIIGIRPHLVGSGAASGMTAKVTIAGVIDSIGASVKKTRCASPGFDSSLRMFFRPSASGWPSPPGPTRFGPRRSCIHALIFRSRSVSIATVTRTATKMTRIFTTDVMTNAVSES
jgi:hypothetical protein